MSKTTRASLLNTLSMSPLPGLPGGPPYRGSGHSVTVIGGFTATDSRVAGVKASGSGITTEIDELTVVTETAGPIVGQLVAEGCGVGVAVMGSAKIQIGTMRARCTPIATLVGDDAHLRIGDLHQEPDRRK